MRLYFAPGCPYAQRTRALLAALNEAFDAVEIDLSNKPPEFLAKSPTGAVPMLEDGDFVLFESAVVNEYLAEKFAWKDAYAPDVKQRARERLAMRRFDDVLVPLFFRALKDDGAVEANKSWEKELAYFADVVRESKPRSLLGFHVATHWVRMKWVKPSSPLVMAMQRAAGTFLDAAAALPEVVHTLPDREAATKAILTRFG